MKSRKIYVDLAKLVLKRLYTSLVIVYYDASSKVSGSYSNGFFDWGVSIFPWFTSTTLFMLLLEEHESIDFQFPPRPVVGQHNASSIKILIIPVENNLTLANCKNHFVNILDKFLTCVAIC